MVVGDEWFINGPLGQLNRFAGHNDHTNEVMVHLTAWLLLTHLTTAFPPHSIPLLVSRRSIQIADPYSSDCKIQLQRDHQWTIWGKGTHHSSLLFSLP